MLLKNTAYCPFCDKYFRRKPGRKLTKFCSQKCYNKARKHEHLCVLHGLPKDTPYSATAKLQYVGKKCEQCKKMMLPKRRADGRIYDIAQFMQRRWCSRICSWIAMYGYDPSEDVYDVFVREIENKKGPNECWPVAKDRQSPQGYGIFYARGALQKAYRVAFEMYKEVIPDGMLVRHTCDNPPCTNPNHLVIGTYKDNAMDRKTRNRNAKQKKFCDNSMSALSKDQYEEVLQKFKSGMTITEIAKAMNVTWQTASRPLKYYNVYVPREIAVDLKLAKKIADEYAAGGISQDALARKYNCTQGIVSRIHLRKGPYAQIDHAMSGEKGATADAGQS